MLKTENFQLPTNSILINAYPVAVETEVGGVQLAPETIAQKEMQQQYLIGIVVAEGKITEDEYNRVTSSTTKGETLDESNTKSLIGTTVLFHKNATDLLDIKVEGIKYPLLANLGCISAILTIEDDAIDAVTQENVSSNTLKEIIKDK